jgi:hypothetical protein
MAMRERIKKGVPGSPCPKGFAVTSTEFTDKPLCVASRQYQKKKLEEIGQMDLPETEKEQRRKNVAEKMCICDHLGNGVLIKLGLADESRAPQAICPGPNIAWFNRTYTLKEMVDHIYGRGPALVPAHRPHMLAKELMMNVDYFETLAACSANDDRADEDLFEYKTNLEKGIELCREISERPSFPDENLPSLRSTVEQQRDRLARIWDTHIGNKKETHVSSLL